MRTSVNGKLFVYLMRILFAIFVFPAAQAFACEFRTYEHPEHITVIVRVCEPSIDVTIYLPDSEPRVLKFDPDSGDLIDDEIKVGYYYEYPNKDGATLVLTKPKGKPLKFELERKP